MESYEVLYSLTGFLSTDTKQTARTNVKTLITLGRNQIRQHRKCSQVSERQMAPAA